MDIAFPRLLFAGDSCLVAEFGRDIDMNVNSRVQQLRKKLEQAPFRGLRELVPTYRSLAIYFDPRETDTERLLPSLRKVLDTIDATNAAASSLVEVPVLYGGEYGPDLDNVASHANISSEEVIRRHTERECYCYMLGFTPGFAYLGGMDESIAAPRLPQPRTVIPAGSVGIAGKQTGIYPIDSPGGWQLIGRTPLRLFDPAANPPTLFDAGLRIRFVSVDRATYDNVASQVAQGVRFPDFPKGGPA